MAPTYKKKRPSAFGADYPFVLHETLRSASEEYEVLEYLGRGTFSQVVKCCKKSTNETVAVKIFKNHPSCKHQGRMEMSILSRLAQGPANKSVPFVRPFDSFLHKTHTCLVFEILALSLHDYFKQNHYLPLPLSCIRPVLLQVLTALLELKRLGIVHADLKPQNIMLVDPERQPFRVKIIDFGCSSFGSTAIATTYVQSRYYRAPEVILGLPFAEAIDMWSVGCAIAELFIAWPLYPGSSEYDQIRYIIEVQGQPEQHILDVATKTPLFFSRENKAGYSFWQLKSPQVYEKETGVESKEWRKFVFSSLDDVALVNFPGYLHGTNLLAEQADRHAFVNLLKHMLTLNPEHRISPDDALNHSFFNFGHLVNYGHCETVHASVKLMEAFWFPDNDYATAPAFDYGAATPAAHPMQAQASFTASGRFRADSVPPPSTCASGMTSPDSYATTAAMAWPYGSPAEAFPQQQHARVFQENMGHVMLLSPAAVTPTDSICRMVPSMWNPMIDNALFPALSTDCNPPFLVPTPAMIPTNSPMAVFPIAGDPNAWGQAVFFTLEVMQYPTDPTAFPSGGVFGHNTW